MSKQRHSRLWQVTASSALAGLLLIFGVIPAKAITFTDYFSIDYNISCNKSSVTEMETFIVTITGTAICTNDLPSPYDAASQVRIRGRVVACTEEGEQGIILNQGYSLEFTPTPTKESQSVRDSQSLTMQFPSGTKPGTYTLNGELVEAQLKAGVWLNVTGYLPQSMPMGDITVTGNQQNQSGDKGLIEEGEHRLSAGEEPAKPETSTPRETASRDSFILNNLSIGSNPVKAGEPITVHCEVTNTGESEGNYSLTLLVDNTREDVLDLILEGKETRKITMSIDAASPGEHLLTAGELSILFTVNDGTFSFRYLPAVTVSAGLLAILFMVRFTLFLNKRDN